MISGVMPKFQQWVHVCSCGFPCLLFAGLCVLAGTLFVAGLTGAGETPTAFVVVSVPFAAFAVWAIVSLIRGLKTQVTEFSYDGRQLRFRTIADTGEQVRELPDIAEVREGRSGRGSTCYVLAFRDGKKVYLDYSLQNVAILAARLRYDAGRSQSRSAESLRRVDT